MSRTPFFRTVALAVPGNDLAERAVTTGRGCSIMERRAETKMRCGVTEVADADVVAAFDDPASVLLRGD